MVEDEKDFNYLGEIEILNTNGMTDREKVRVQILKSISDGSEDDMQASLLAQCAMLEAAVIASPFPRYECFFELSQSNRIAARRKHEMEALEAVLAMYGANRCKFHIAIVSYAAIRLSEMRKAPQPLGEIECALSKLKEIDIDTISVDVAHLSVPNLFSNENHHSINDQFVIDSLTDAAEKKILVGASNRRNIKRAEEFWRNKYGQ